ncbi:hypothetical protein LCGC14_1939390 [marine sediment metagenome]|uniref:Uncharacterized protein n=1 Tax=marine sediment metagenome TaxID=412755 RepID=A0A0F9FKQ2_9ZZZZ
MSKRCTVAEQSDTTRDLIEAAALARMIHANGSGPLIRALNARLHRLLLCLLGTTIGSARIEHKVEEAVSAMSKEFTSNSSKDT